MRYSIASQALCGAVTVSALALPATPVQKRVQLVDLSEFKSFPTLDPQDILGDADDAIRELFNQGQFNDGPLDALGNFLNSSKNKNGGNRHLDLLDDIKDKIEDQFDGLQDEIKGQVQDQVEDLGSKIKGQGPVQDVTNGLKTEATQLTNGAQLKDGGVKATAAGTCDPSNPNVRFEWANYQNADRTAFVQAIKCLMGKPSGGAQYAGAQNRYEDLVSVHRDMTANIHQTASFLVWHRYFVWVFEQMLRQECGFDRAMPWWDETKNAGAFAASDIFSDAWFGQLPAKTSDGQGTCIESGAFAGTTLHVGPGSANQDHCLSRAVDESQTAQCNSDFTNSCLSRGAYDDFRNCFELGPHGYGHNGIGAVMAEVSSSVGDPIFFMHHLFVDHTFRIWQNADSSRLTTISGCADSANPCTPISLDTKLSSSGLQPDLTVGQVLNTLGGSLCYRYDY